MNDSYLETGEGVNPRPAYFAVIPATVRYCKTLPPAAKLLYGELTALCSVEGYCWAANVYFEELYGVDRSTVQRWLASLVREGFIRVEMQPGNTSRRIYDLTTQKPNPPQKRGGGAAKMGGWGRENAAQSITKNNTLSIKPLNVADVAAPQEQKGSASPPPLTGYKAKLLTEIEAKTGDVGSRRRFKQLLDITEDHSAIDLWQGALSALEHAQNAAAGLVERPGAYFCAVLCRSLSERGVVVPAGTPSDRRSVRSQIAASFAAADAKGGQA